MEGNLFINYEGNNSTETKEEQNKKESTFYDRILEERKKTEMRSEEVVNVAASKLKIKSEVTQAPVAKKIESKKQGISNLFSRRGFRIGN